MKTLINKNNFTKKKLLFCSYDLCLGGIETSLINLLKNINYKKYDVTLLLENKSGDLLNKLPKNIKIIEYKTSKNKNIIIRKTINLIKRFHYYFKYKNYYDFSCCYATYSLPCNIISRISSKNNSIYIHSNYYELFKHDKSKTIAFFTKRNITKFKSIIFVSNESKKDLCKLLDGISNKSKVINNLTDQDYILEESKKDIKEEHPKNKTLFCFIGRLENDSKNFIRMINSFKNVSGSFELWIIGDGKDKNFLHELIKKNNLDDKIKLLGKKINPFPYIKLADYIVLTSDYEGFPVIYTESIILKTPIISTIDVTDDYININNHGIVVSKNEDLITDKINYAIKNKIKIKSLDFNTINKEKMKKLEKIMDGEDND